MSKLIDTIRQAVIGERLNIKTPFGTKPLVYADYTASGRSLDFIEDFIHKNVLPFYANTHTEASFTGAQISALREEARQQIRIAVNATNDNDVNFCGSGATAAINKVIDILNLRLPNDLNHRYQLEQHIPAAEQPVVFIGAYEHHSNELPWRESIAKLIPIPLNSQGQIDLDVLESQLEQYQAHPLKIGSFSAASNVTGIKTDVDAITRLLHRYGALSFWDYAAAAPYVGIDVAGENNKHGDNSKDAVFISPHKFIGGPGTPGVLVIKRNLLTNRVPAIPGGGTVAYVTPESHRYINNTERREEGGTPAIVESIRAGLVFKLQQDVGTDEIERREAHFVNKAIECWSRCNNIDILGNTEAPRLSIVSLRIKHGNRDLHYGFVVALLNDLFGIQARGGCSCAGPYGHSLLNMDETYSNAIDKQLQKGYMILRPGWVRLNFNYFIDEHTFEYLVSAVELVAQYGWRLLPYYHFDQACGVWRFQNTETHLPSHIANLDFTNLENIQEQTLATGNIKQYLTKAKSELCRTEHYGESYSINLPAEAEKLRWFVLPQEITRQKACA